MLSSAAQTMKQPDKYTCMYFLRDYSSPLASINRENISVLYRIIKYMEAGLLGSGMTRTFLLHRAPVFSSFLNIDFFSNKSKEAAAGVGDRCCPYAVLNFIYFGDGHCSGEYGCL